MSPETLELRGFVEEAAYVYGHARTAENERRLQLAWADFLEALYDDWSRGVARGSEVA